MPKGAPQGVSKDDGLKPISFQCNWIVWGGLVQSSFVTFLGPNQPSSGYLVLVGNYSNVYPAPGLYFTLKV